MRVSAILLILFSAALFSPAAYSVCMTEVDADAYGCFPLHEDAKAMQWCSNKHGKRYKAYITDNTCSKELAALLRGESYDSSQDNKVVEAACMTYEQGMDNGCQYYDYLAAQRYCAENYGNRYIPFVPDNGKCSMARASGLRGELSGKHLVEGLSSKMDEVETIMTMIDREGLNPLGGLESKSPKIGNEFYTDTVQALMAKMNTVKKTLYENGQKNVPIKDAKTSEYLKYSFRYLNVLARLYKVYAFVAHENHVALKTYTFDNLEYLNLKLKKEHALEILARANYRAKTIDDGKSIEFLIGQQDRQTYELLAINDPHTKKDYAKLVTFLGVRENLTNLWGVQRMSPDHVTNAETNSCGNFLSFRAGRGGEMEESAAYKELFEYDVFYQDYIPRWESLAKASQTASLLDQRKATDLGEAIFKSVPELKDLVLNQMGGTEGLRAQAAKDASMLIEAENATWENFSYGHFSAIVMPGDDVLHRDALMERIAEEAFYKRLDGVVDIFIASYLWVSDASVRKMEKEIRDYAHAHLKGPFFDSMKSALSNELKDYNSASRLADQNRKEKEEQTYQVAKKAVVAVNVLEALEKKTFDFRKMKTLEPRSIEELFMLFQDRVERDYKDLRQTLKHNDKLAGVLNEMFQEISQKYKERFVSAEGELTASGAERSKGLREIAYSVAKKYAKKYPFEISRYRMREALPEVARDNTRVATNRRYIPVLKDNSAVGMSKKELLDNIPEAKEFNRENYVAKVDNTRVARPKLFLGATKPVEKSPNSGRNNPDRVTTGEIGRPLEVTSPGKLKTHLGETAINNGKLLELFKNYGLLSRKGQKEKVTSLEKELELPVWDNDSVIEEPGFFIYRALEALNLDRVGMRKSSYGRFGGDIQAQKLLAENRVSSAYQAAPLLRIEHKLTKTVTKYCYTKTDKAYRCDEKKIVRTPLLERIAFGAYNHSSNRFSSKKAKALISKTVDMAIENTDEKLSKFCDVNYLNYKNDPDFKETFRASKYLRATITASVGKKATTIERLSRLDAEIKKEIRGRWQVLEEDYLMPAFDITMYVSLAALAVVLVVGSGGAALPGVFAGVYGLASTILAFDLVIGVGLGVGNAVARYNTHFIETPAQLRFQESLATSQVDLSKTVDWGMQADDREMLKSKQVESALFAAMDVGFSFMLINQIKVSTGMVGKKAFQRLTGTKLRGWSARPASMLKNPRFSQLRKDMGFLKAVKSKGHYIGKKMASFMPKYQALPEKMIKSGALRMGLVRKAKQLNIGNSPWAILDDLNAHTSKLSSKLSDYKKFVQADKKIAQSVRLNRALKPKEIFAHFDKTAVAYIPKTLWKRVKSGNMREIRDFFVKYDDVWEELKRAQGAVVNQRVTNIDKVAKKLEDFQAAVGSGHYRDGNYMDKFIKTLTDNEILALEEVAKKSKGVFSHFKSIFKDHARVVRGLKPVSYLAGYKGQGFSQNAYPESYFLDGELDLKYSFKSDAEDLINFYESMMSSSAANSATVKEARESAEEALARKIRNDGNGNISDY